MYSLDCLRRHVHEIILQIALDNSLIYAMVYLLDNCIWSTEACSRFSFSRRSIQLLLVQTTKNASFRINELRNANFVSLLF